ncbi:hypothetical protein DFS34DRAFT_625756 [Phlyctochytrium arcticum]|nr:hypothetical protein DFS34DRAFT_625756 [Phlyctochytrium arcticum]
MRPAFMHASNYAFFTFPARRLPACMPVHLACSSPKAGYLIKAWLIFLPVFLLYCLGCNLYLSCLMFACFFSMAAFPAWLNFFCCTSTF